MCLICNGYRVWHWKVRTFKFFFLFCTMLWEILAAIHTCVYVLQKPIQWTYIYNKLAMVCVQCIFNTVSISDKIIILFNYLCAM